MTQFDLQFNRITPASGLKIAQRRPGQKEGVMRLKDEAKEEYVARNGEFLS